MLYRTCKPSLHFALPRVISCEIESVEEGCGKCALVLSTIWYMYYPFPRNVYRTLQGFTYVFQQTFIFSVQTTNRILTECAYRYEILLMKNWPTTPTIPSWHCQSRHLAGSFTGLENDPTIMNVARDWLKTMQCSIMQIQGKYKISTLL